MTGHCKRSGEFDGRLGEYALFLRDIFHPSIKRNGKVCLSVCILGTIIETLHHGKDEHIATTLEGLSD